MKASTRQIVIAWLLLAALCVGAYLLHPDNRRRALCETCFFPEECPWECPTAPAVPVREADG